MTGFEDYFSKQAREYARYRPQYPEELFAFLASAAPNRQLAWDCGTGNGQAARALAKHFKRVVASDASAEQIAQAVPEEGIEYRVARAEDMDLADHSVDLVTVAMAVHWFDLESFYRVVRRVGREDGVLALWMYHLPQIEPAIDAIVTEYYEEVLAGFWPPLFRYVDERYRNLPFPFDEIEAPGFEIRQEWDLGRLAGFLDSWSATRRYQAERGEHPLNLIWQRLSKSWGESSQTRLVRSPLYMLAGRIG